MPKRIIIVLFFLLLLSYSHLRASSTFSFTNLGFSSQYGFLAPHGNDMLHLYNGHFPLYSLSVSGKTTGSNEWHRIYNFPEIGIDFLYTDLSYPEVLGQAYALMPHIKFSIWERNSFNLSLKNCLGLGYLTKKYDRTENYKNTAIGTHLNLALNIVLESEITIKDNYIVSAGIGMTHFSNGRTAVPNKGINIPALKLGFAYSKPRNLPSTDEVLHQKRNTELIMVASGGFSADYPTGGPISPRAGLSTLISLPVSKGLRLGAGHDFFYYYNKEHLLSHLTGDYQEQQHFNHGAFFAFQMDFGRTSFLIHKGVYVYDKHDFQRSFFYHRAGFRHKVYRNIILNLTLKTHYFKAQFIEMGIGYNFL